MTERRLAKWLGRGYGGPVGIIGRGTQFPRPFGKTSAPLGLQDGNAPRLKKEG